MTLNSWNGSVEISRGETNVPNKAVAGKVVNLAVGKVGSLDSLFAPNCSCIATYIYDNINGSEKGTNVGLNMGYVNMNQLLCQTGVPNCIGSQIPI